MKFCYRHKVSLNPVWIPDEDTNECYCCLGIFTFSIRRHHCRTCGNVVCDSCSKTKEMIKGNKVRICRSCNTYLWIRRSGEDINNLLNVINKCLLNYYNKWSNIKLLLKAQSKIIKQIQINHKNNNFSDNNVYVSILNYKTNNNSNNFDFKHIGLNKIESLLEYERNNDMIYFIGIPPKHNSKLSPWTRRLLLITNDSKILMSSPLDNTYSLYQFIENENQKTYIHFQYYAPLNRLFQQQIIPINEQFIHIPQFKNTKQKTVIIFMTKRNGKLKSRNDITNNNNDNNINEKQNYSSVIINNKNWSYFKENNKKQNENKITENKKQYNDNDNDNDNINNDIFGINLIDLNKQSPTLVILPFCIGFHNNINIIKPKLPLEPPPSRPRNKSLGDVLPEPHKPYNNKLSSPTPPLPPPYQPPSYQPASYQKEKEKTKQKEEGFGSIIINKFFKRPKSKEEHNDNKNNDNIYLYDNDNDIMLHPQHNMFDDYDWQCLDYSHQEFIFDSAQDLYDTLNCHRHKYLRNFYKNIVLFHEIIQLMSKSVKWNNENVLLKLEILWVNLVFHTEHYKKLPLTFSKMLLIKNGHHKYWKEIGFQGKDPLTDFRGMGEFALNCLVYFATNYQSHCQVIFSKTRSQNNYYPLCASFINIVNLICELTNARKVEELDITQQTLLFKLFILDTNYSNNAFQELFCLICRVFDNVWRATKSFYWDFPKLYNAFRDRITFLLTKEPKSLKTLMEWLEVDTYIFEYKEADFNQMDQRAEIINYLQEN